MPSGLFPRKSRRWTATILLLWLLGLVADCRLTPRPAPLPSPHPYLPLEPGTEWTLELTLWQYPSRVDAAAVVFTREEVFRLVSAELTAAGWTLHTEPPLATLLFLEDLNLDSVDLVQDERGIWLGPPGRKKHPGVLLLPPDAAVGHTWSAVSPSGIPLKFQVLGRSEPFPPGAETAAPDRLTLEIVFASEGQAQRRLVWLGKGLGVLGLEAYRDSRLFAQAQRTNLNPFLRDP